MRDGQWLVARSGRELEKWCGGGEKIGLMSAQGEMQLFCGVVYDWNGTVEKSGRKIIQACFINTGFLAPFDILPALKDGDSYGVQHKTY